MRTPATCARPAIVETHHEIERERPAQHLDAGAERRFVERALHLGAALVTAGVHDAVDGCGRPRGSSAGRRCPRPGRTPRRAASGSGSTVGASSTSSRTTASSHRPAPAASVSRDVVLERVVGSSTPGQTALRPRRAPRDEDVLGDDEHGAHRSRGERGGEPGRAGAEHDDVDVALPRRGRGGQAHRQHH